MHSSPSLPDGAVTHVLRRKLRDPLDAVTSRIETLLLILCSLAILAAMLLTTADVILRYGFKNPITWGFDFIMLYLMPAAYYMGFAYGMRTGAHLSVDFFIGLLPRFVKQRLCPLILLIGAALMFYVAWLLFHEAAESLIAGHRLFGSVAWLTWPTAAIIGVSIALFAVRVVLTAFDTAFPDPEA